MALPLRIKICGITSSADAALAAQLGADAVGLNFYSQSPRLIAVGEVSHVLQTLPPFVEAVGVFTNETWRQVRFRAKRLNLRTVQMHGDEHEPGYNFQLRRIDAFPIYGLGSLKQITDYLHLAGEGGQMPQAILADGHAPGLHGGTGQTAPWNLLANFRPPVPLILAGGLTPDNVAQAIRIVRPYAVDVASGVEREPGRKDVEKMKRFIGNARDAAAGL